MGEQATTRRIRSDTLATRTALVAAVTELIADRGNDFQLADVARRAGTSTATAYRHFASKDAAIEMAYAKWVDDLVVAVADGAAGNHGWARFQAACQAWVASTVRFAPATARLRSSSGLLGRLHAGDSAVQRVWRELEPILDELMDLELVPRRDPQFLFLCWNSLFDERNLLDLHVNLGWPVERISATLGDAMAAVLRSPAG